MTSPRQLLRTSNLAARKDLGQNFLDFPQIVTTIAGRVTAAGAKSVLEIGAGLGALTLPLAQGVEQVVAIEKDTAIAAILAGELKRQDVTNVQLINGDIMKVDLAAIIAGTGSPLLVVGNLPYNISSQILFRLMEIRDRISRAILMFQKELADRLLAPPGNRTYGGITVMLQYCGRIQRLAHVPATAFFPKPKVDSMILEIDFEIPPCPPAVSEKMLFAVIRAAFGQRRKMIRNSLSAGLTHLTTQKVMAALGATGIDPKRRAETLSVTEFIRLSDHIATLPEDAGSDGGHS